MRSCESRSSACAADCFLRVLLRRRPCPARSPWMRRKRTGWARRWRRRHLASCSSSSAAVSSVLVLYRVGLVMRHACLPDKWVMLLLQHGPWSLSCDSSASCAATPSRHFDSSRHLTAPRCQSHKTKCQQQHTESLVASVLRPPEQEISECVALSNGSATDSRGTGVSACGPRRKRSRIARPGPLSTTTSQQASDLEACPRDEMYHCFLSFIQVF